MHGEIRLGNHTDNQADQTREGRLELCLNNAWGTVCGSSSSFTPADALVACDQLSGFQRSGAEIVLPSIPASSGPIYLDQLLCTGSETSLLDCPTALEHLGLVNCDHSLDVAVRCNGELIKALA